MEKNPKYTQPSAKGVPSDAKKNQDVPNSKVFPRTSRRRESPGANNFPKYDQTRKYNVQKTKSFDKRPKPKGQYHGSSKEDTKVVEEVLPEPGSVLVHRSKKQNLNHLLNFHYEPRKMLSGSDGCTHGNMTKGYSRNSNRWLPPVQRHKYNKEQFLQASCQFVVTANGNYSLYLSDPDILVDWELVEQIKIHSCESLSCPICLFSPVAGKMTRCGHVYCWPCILHYLALSDKSCRKCPICCEPIQKSDLKSVTEITQSILNLGETITLRLMRREKGSLVALPVGSAFSNPTNFCSVSELDNNPVYSKLLIANTKDIMSIIDLERTQLKLELDDNPNSPENCFIEEALQELFKRERKLLRKTKSEKIPEDTPNATQMQDNDCEKQLKNSQDVIKNNNEEFTKATENSPSDTQTSNAQKFFYFYQVDDGRHVYLHALNLKMLKMQYCNLENSPHIITGKLLEKEEGCVTNDLRHRLKYLSHLPLTCQFEIAEIELKPPIVSEEVLSCFQDQLTLRHNRRQQREREERKREKKITEEENKRMKKYPTPIVHIDSQQHFPQWQPELFAEESFPSVNTLDEVTANNQPESPLEQGPSFAEMLRNTGTRFKSQSAWPSIGTANASSSRVVNKKEDYPSVLSNGYRNRGGKKKENG